MDQFPAFLAAWLIVTVMKNWSVCNQTVLPLGEKQEPHPLLLSEMIDQSNWLERSLSLSFCVSSTPSGRGQDKMYSPGLFCLYLVVIVSVTLVNWVQPTDRDGTEISLQCTTLSFLYLALFLTLLKTPARSEGAVGVWLLSWALMWGAVRLLQRLGAEVCSLSSCPTCLNSPCIGWEG